MIVEEEKIIVLKLLAANDDSRRGVSIAPAQLEQRRITRTVDSMSEAEGRDRSAKGGQENILDRGNERTVAIAKKLKVNFHLYQPTLYLPKLDVNQLCFIFQAASKPFERAYIVEPIVKDSSSKFHGRLKVKYTFGKQSTYFVRPKNIIKVIQSAGPEFKNCIVTKDTNMYRRLAHAQARPNDTALEIGCDFGYTTKILGEKCKIALGVDKRYPHVKEAIKRYGSAGDNNIFFHAVDIFTDSDNILGKYSDRLNQSPSLIFIDINGNRELEAVVRALNVVYERFLASPRGHQVQLIFQLPIPRWVKIAAF